MRLLGDIARQVLADARRAMLENELNGTEADLREGSCDLHPVQRGPVRCAGCQLDEHLIDKGGKGCSRKAEGDHTPRLRCHTGCSRGQGE